MLRLLSAATLAAVLMSTPVAAQQGTSLGDERAGPAMAQNLEGTPVLNGSGEEIGEVTGLVVDQEQIHYAVIATGGFLGLAEKEVALPIDHLQPDGEGHLITDLTQDELGGLPSYKEGPYQPVAPNDPRNTR